MRRLCGFLTIKSLPCEGTISNFFKEFCQKGLSEKVHEETIKRYLGEPLLEHVSRDATAIPAREKAAKTCQTIDSQSSKMVSKPQLRSLFKEENNDSSLSSSQIQTVDPLTPSNTKTDAISETHDDLEKKARKHETQDKAPKSGKSSKKPRSAKAPTKNEQKRLKRQPTMTLAEMIEDLPKQCDYGVKKNSKGVIETWRGYKLHLDVDDRDIPLSFVMTSASTHDSQVAIPLEAITNERVSSCYTIMDKGYVSKDIKNYIESKGKVSIVAPKKPKGGELIPLDPPKKERFKKRSSVERVNGRIKDSFAGKSFRFRGIDKISTHLGFSLIALAAEQIARHIL